MTDFSFIDKGIISPEALQGLLEDPTIHVKLLDASYALPGSGQNPPEVFQQKRIGQAAFFSVDEIADKNTDLPHMLPSPEDFGKAVGDLGVSNNDLVIVYGQTTLAMGPARAWWSFRVFGHDRVAVLDGGLPAWEAAGFAVNTSPASPAAPARFTAQYRPHLIRDMKTIAAESKKGTALILDARPLPRFEGSADEPRPGLRRGHIPGSRSVPAANLIDSAGRLKSQQELESIFRNAGLQGESPVTTTCGSGVTACAIALALYSLGRKDVPVYDGSWSEWGQIGRKTPIASL